MSRGTDNQTSSLVSRRLPTWRSAGLAILVLVVIAGSFQLWRSTTLSGLPYIDDPFDVAKYARIDIPPDENAYTFYRRAHAEFAPVAWRPMPSTWRDWSEVQPAYLEHLASSRKALELWLEGTRRQRALYFQPSEVTLSTILDVTWAVRNLVRLANLRAFQLQQEGNNTEAWTWLRAGLRSSYHLRMNGLLSEAATGTNAFQETAEQTLIWADDPKVDVRLLRVALDDVLAMHSLESVPSGSVRTQYFALMAALHNRRTAENMLGDFGWRFDHDRGEAIAAFRHEPERSRRVCRLIIANWLSACDLPAAEREHRVVYFGSLVLYAPAPGETPVISPEELARWCETTRYAKWFFSVPGWNPEYKLAGSKEITRADLIIHLAKQIYKREKGREPSSVQELVGPYLKAIPAGYTTPESQKERR
jgi:hypothetical protein